MPSSLSRPLGATEQAVWLRDRAHSMHFAIAAQIRGALSLEALTSSLQRLQQRHPLLRVGIELDHSHTPCFVEQPTTIPLRWVSRLEATHWEREVERELSQPFDWSQAPLIRVVWVQGSDVSELIMVCHHAIADGLSVVTLIRDLLGVLARPNEAAISASVSVPAALETLLPTVQKPQPSIIQTLNSKIQLVLVRSLLRLFSLRRTVMAFGKSSSSSSKTPMLRSGMLSPTTTKALMRRCREEQTTVHAAICTAFLFGLVFEKLQQDGSSLQNESKLFLNCFSPISLRSLLPTVAAQVCGLYISFARTSHPLTVDSTFWDVARSLKAQLTAQSEVVDLLRTIHNCEQLIAIHPNPDMVLNTFIQKHHSDLMVTNLGRLNLPNEFGKFKLEALYGPVVMSGFEPERTVGVATLGDRLFFTFLHSTSYSNTKMSRLPEHTIQLIEQILNEFDLSLSMAVEGLSTENNCTQRMKIVEKVS